MTWLTYAGKSQGLHRWRWPFGCALWSCRFGAPPLCRPPSQQIRTGGSASRSPEAQPGKWSREGKWWSLDWACNRSNRRSPQSHSHWPTLRMRDEERREVNRCKENKIHCDVCYHMQQNDTWPILDTRCLNETHQAPHWGRQQLPRAPSWKGTWDTTAIDPHCHSLTPP